MSKSDSKKVSMQPHEESEHLNLVISALNTGLTLISTDMTVVWANDIIKKLFPAANQNGIKCFTAAENRTSPCEGCQAVIAFQDGEVHVRDFQNKQNKRWYQVTALPIKDKDGRVIYVLEASLDISDRKEAEIFREKALEEIRTLKERLEQENVYLREEIRDIRCFQEIVGQSNALQYVLSKVEQVAESDATVLIQGETGTGKELIARAIHESSRFSQNAFIKVNCAAIPDNLIESELFGHEAGAFTGATKLRQGRFELAHGGTIFLDEISELPLSMQGKLLRVLQEKQFERVGGSKTLSVDVRVIAATNRELGSELAEGRFRPDLFYRLNVYPITVPPLRSRKEDIPLLVNHFVSILNSQTGKTFSEIPPQVLEELQAYHWPGNVRELRNVIERAVISCPEPVLFLAEKIAGKDTVSTRKETSKAELLSLQELERRHIQRVLLATKGRISGPLGAATILDMNPSTLRFRMKKLGIKK